jgi:hypothetical protein
MKADVVKITRLDSCGSYEKKAADIEFLYLLVVAKRIAKVKKKHTLAEEVILSSAKDVVSIMIRCDHLIKLQSLSLSNDTIRRRI